MFPVLRVGPLNLQTAGLALLLSFAIGSSLTEREARRLNLPAPAIGNGIFLALFAGLLGARLVYAARYLSSYLANPVDVLSLNPSALAVPEGLAIGAFAALFYWWIKDLSIRSALDASKTRNKNPGKRSGLRAHQTITNTRMAARIS